MPVAIPDSRTFRFLRTHVVECMTFVYLVYIIYSALLPFDFAADTHQPAASGTRFGLYLVSPNMPDVACNLAFYFPFGVLLRAAIRKRNLFGPFSSYLVVFACCGLLSWVTEYTQQFSPTRVSSAADLVCNISGGMAGAALSSFFVALGQAFARMNRENLIKRPSAVAAKVIAIGIALLSLAPFDATFTWNRMRDAAKTAVDSPFGQAGHMESIALSSPDPVLRVAALRDWWNLEMDYLAFIGIYALLYILLMWYFRKHAGLSRLGSAFWGWFNICLLSFVLCIARTFIMSLGFDATYLVAAQIGVGIGLFLYRPIIQLWKPWLHAEKGDDLWSRKQLAKYSAAILCLWVFLREIVPFRFNLNTEAVSDQWAATEWMPFKDYFLAKAPIAVADLMHKLSRFIGLGFLLAVWQATPPLGRKQLGPGACAFLIGFLLFTLECVQLLLPSRIPAISDVLLAAGGTWIGVETFKLLAMYLYSVRKEDAERLLYNVELEDTKEKKPARQTSSQHQRQPLPPA